MVNSHAGTRGAATPGRATRARACPSGGGDPLAAGGVGHRHRADLGQRAVITNAVLVDDPGGAGLISPAAHPLDMAGVANRYLYVLANGLNEIIGYRVASNGGLTQVTTVPVPTSVAGVGAHETSTERDQTDQTCSRGPSPPRGHAVLRLARRRDRDDEGGEGGEGLCTIDMSHSVAAASRRDAGLPLGRAQPGRMVAESAGRGT
jgi:hypothetical protein